MNNKSTICTGILACLGLVATNAQASTPDSSKFTLAENAQVKPATKNLYIVQLKENAGIHHALNLTNITDKKTTQQLANSYNAQSVTSKNYVKQLKNKQRNVMAATGISEPLYSYGHTFNGFTVTLTNKQVSALRNHPDVAAVWEDELLPLETANTPEFLGLTAASGLHNSGFTGEDVIIGIVDTGINLEHPSFADDGSYSDPSSLGWAGSCDNSTDESISCNNKLIGAKYFNASFLAAAGSLAAHELNSPRDQDGHGSHVAGTAGGNASVSALVNGLDAGFASGMAPRARIASYKACWDAPNPDASGCYGGDTMAAIEAAVADGVDVINYSIGGSLTTLLTGPAQAFLDATAAGVFVATSAGNSGPDAGTVGMPTPWVTNVAASTYDGSVPSLGIDILSGTLAGMSLVADEAAFTPSLAATGDINGELALVEPFEACSEITNKANVAGKIALISRGSCAFVDKVANAEAAGALAAIVYNNQPGGEPFAMGGSLTTSIPALMVSNDNGIILRDDLTAGASVTVDLSATNTTERAVTGNIMADFSSRGPNMAVADLIVPDITAPGVKILAAAPNGNTFNYLQGTSMASPHIAGIAALVKQAHPEWSPAAIRSAIMTTARQDLVKEDGATPADPFDFGAGHVVPNSSINPGLVYDAGLADYVAFICGKANEVATVEALFGAGVCAWLADNGYLGGSQFNHPSIAISALGEQTTVVRYVTNVDSASATYHASIVAPAGVDVEVLVYDGASFVPGNSLTIDAGATGIYALTFDNNDSAVFEQWVFGSVTWSDGLHNVRSPIAVMPVLPPQINVASEVITKPGKDRQHIFIPVEFNYTGKFITQGHGMASSQENIGQVFQDADQSYQFNEVSLGFNLMMVDPGTKVARFALYTDETPDPATDLDLYVYACQGWSCSLVGQSTSASSDEAITIIDPMPLNDIGSGNVYIAFVHGWSLAGAQSIIYNLNEFKAGDNDNNLNVTARHSAIKGKVKNINLHMKDLMDDTRYLGGVSYFNQDGENIGFTLVEVNK
jgi:subtilisin family serine protease